MNKDYYNTLGISRAAGQDEIKKAYRKLAHEYHPDKKTGNEAKFKEVNEAYQILSDPKKRSNYDNFGFAYNDGGFPTDGGSGFGGQDFSNIWDFFGGGQGKRGSAEDIFDMFGEILGGFRQSHYQEDGRGEDLYLELLVNKKDLGVTRMIEYEVLGLCDFCNNSGIEKGYKIITCKVCNGSGQIRQTSRSGYGFFSRISICPTCGGRGKYPEKECHKCKGSGRIKIKKVLEVRLPENINDSHNVVIPGGGNIDRGTNEAGDLVLNIRVK